MKQILPNGLICLVLPISVIALLACQKQAAQNEIVDTDDGAQKIVTTEHLDSANTLKPRPPITVSYQILGTPQIGQPLEIELSVSSEIIEGPIQVKYRAMDDQALSFMPSASGEQSFKLSGAQNNGKQKVVVVPQREGRSYFTVSTEVETEDGTMMSSTSIAIQVGDKPVEKEINGELKTDPSGETVVSMPATQP